MLRKSCLALFAWLLLGPGALAEPLAFVGVNVIPMDEPGVLENQTVLVDQGKIQAVGPVGSVSLPPKVRRIDGAGRYLMPGLAEMHAHIPPPGQGKAFQDRVLSLYVVNGITTARGMLGHPNHLEIRDAVNAGEELLAPRIFTSGPSLNGNSVKNPQQAQDMVRAQKAAGYDFLKLHPGLNRDEYDAIVETATEIDMPYAGHVSENVGLARTLEAQQGTVDHLDGYMQLVSRPAEGESLPRGSFFGVLMGPLAQDELIEDIAAKTADAGVWNVPTQTLFENVVATTPAETLLAWPEMRYMPTNMVYQWNQAKVGAQNEEWYTPELANASVSAKRKLIKALHEAGAGLLLGSDAPQIFNVPGFAAHRELALYVAAGLSPQEALATGTINPAKYFGKEEEFGSITQGRMADLILLRDNPLDDIENTRSIEGIMLRGRWLPRKDLDRILESLVVTD